MFSHVECLSCCTPCCVRVVLNEALHSAQWPAWYCSHNPAAAPCPQPGNVLLKGSRGDVRGFTAQVSACGG